MKRLLAVIAVILALPSLAQAEILTAVQETSTGSELQATRQAIEYSALRQEKLANEAAALDRQQEELSRQLIETAAQIRARETMRLESQERIDRLSRDEAALRKNLTERNDALAGLLGGLVRLEQNPPPALLASPQDALKASRAAMLFGALVPALRFETAALSRDLARLIHLRSSISAENRSLAANLEKLRFARLQLEGFFDRRKALLAATGEARQGSRRLGLADEPQLPNEEELAEALSRVGVADVLVNALTASVSLGYHKLSAGARDLPQARLAIEALREKKGAMNESEYYAQLESHLVELAELYEKAVNTIPAVE
jgi:septal ring factor EnvC (AmiA/AmiB activator)